MKDEQHNVLSEFHVKYGIANMNNNQNSLMVVMNDISEKMKLRESKISERLKTTMLCTISHEIRSPVNQISGALALMQHGSEKDKQFTIEMWEKQQNLLNIAQSASESLKYKVDDLLDFYEIDTGSFELEESLFDIKSVVTTVQKLFEPLINSKKIKLCNFIHNNVPTTIVSDQKRIIQILVNIVGNSVKYTLEGYITLVVDWLDVEERGGLNGFVRFSVSDSGVGISEEKRKTLFKFLQPNLYKNIDESDSSSQDQNQLAGTGLGISQKIAWKLGSEIKFISSVDSGSKFWIEIKAQRTAVNVSRQNFEQIDKFIQNNHASDPGNSLSDQCEYKVGAVGWIYTIQIYYLYILRHSTHFWIIATNAINAFWSIWYYNPQLDFYFPIYV